MHDSPPDVKHVILLPSFEPTSLLWSLGVQQTLLFGPFHFHILDLILNFKEICDFLLKIGSIQRWQSQLYFSIFLHEFHLDDQPIIEKQILQAVFAPCFLLQIYHAGVYKHLPLWWGNEVLAIPTVEFELSQVIGILVVYVADHLIKRPRTHIKMKAERVVCCI